MIDETVDQIRTMQTQSASIVAVKAATALKELIDREHRTVEEFTRSLERNSSALRQANHSHALLFTTQQRIVTELNESDPDTVKEAKERLRTTIEAMVDEIESSKRKAAETAAGLIEDGDVILTHENSSTVMATLEYALDSGTSFDLFVTESRPRFLGRRTARQIGGREGVNVTQIVDGAVGYYMSDCDRVMIGMNCLIAESVYNRIGTYPVVAMAACEGIPVTVVGVGLKFIGGGFEFKNKFGPAVEVMREPVDTFDIANPGYDATPTRLLDTVVTEDGVIEFQAE
ncbi:translation initiation factor eIF-2B [Haloferax sp. DFSO60]|uniref:translation initiation factor eIF-2B n=1 Tax=Haloferax sp. DFSO60 TaxID=3388652 RepID=UPI00397E2A1C